MKKLLFIYFRPDHLDISSYPFFHKLVEKLHTSCEISLIDMSNSDISNLSYGIKQHFHFKEKQFTQRGLRRFNRKYFAFLCAQKVNAGNFNEVITIGTNSIDIIPHLKQRTKAKVSYIDDEFPWLFRRDLDHIASCLSKADLIISLDKIREETLFNRLKLPPIATHVIANIPADAQLKTKQENWAARFNLDPKKKYILFHGSLGQLCQLPEIMCTVPLWGAEFELIILGWREKYQEIYKHLLIPKIHIIDGRLQDDEYSSLIQFCYASLGLYSEFSDLEFVGTSSGKILRSILLGTPIITNHYPSLQFVADLGAGVQIKSILEIPQILESGNLRHYVVDPKNNSFEKEYEALKMLISN